MEDEQRPMVDYHCFTTGVPKSRCGCGAIGCGPRTGQPMTATEVQERARSRDDELKKACDRFEASMDAAMQPAVNRIMALMHRRGVPLPDGTQALIENWPPHAMAERIVKEASRIAALEATNSELERINGERSDQTDHIARLISDNEDLAMLLLAERTSHAATLAENERLKAAARPIGTIAQEFLDMPRTVPPIPITALRGKP